MTDTPSQPVPAQPAPPEQTPAQPATTGAAAQADAAPQAAPQGKPTITYDDFAKLDLRVGKVLDAKPHPNADKLLVLTVDIGTETRQILAGIRAWYPPEALIGKEIVVIANLAPRKMRGLESCGMLLAASEGEGDNRTAIILQPQRDVPPGSPVS